MSAKNVRPSVIQNQVHASIVGQDYVAGKDCQVMVVTVLAEFIGLILVSPRIISVVNIIKSIFLLVFWALLFAMHLLGK